MPWLLLRWILEDRYRPVAAATLVRGDARVGRLRIPSAPHPDLAPVETPPPTVFLRRRREGT